MKITESSMKKVKKNFHFFWFRRSFCITFKKGEAMLSRAPRAALSEKKEVMHTFYVLLAPQAKKNLSDPPDPLV